jgi:putative phosphoesterase
MRILLVADIHANWPALQAIQEKFDVCFCLGDIVDYGLEPVPCIDWVRAHAQFTVRGNHDHAVAQNVITNGRNGFKYLAGVTRGLNRALIGSHELRFLAALPVTRSLTIADTRFMLVHATPRDPLDEYARPDVEFWSRRLERVDTDVICVGHTHQPYALQVGEKLVINPGSVGQPRDGDPRAAYAIIDDHRVELKRVEYPIDSTIKVIQESSLPDMAKDMLREVLRTGRSGAKAENNSNNKTP